MANRQDKKGRSKGDGHHVRLYAFMEMTAAWRDLSPLAVKAWLTIGLLYNGSNNGNIVISGRNLGRRIGAHQTSAARALQELENKGFIAKAKASSFGLKQAAAEYRLTHLRNDITGEAATHDYRRSTPWSSNPDDARGNVLEMPARQIRGNAS